ncbi:MAG TPA: FIST N-terminal domain-containing protein [Solirubrobacterales bacterium]|nr:FIST N-terminal domain-containing protein [Solirubrobacterales bacterium]
MSKQPRIAVGLSQLPSTIDAFAEAAEVARSGLGGSADLCFAFVGGQHLAELDAALLEIRARLDPAAMVGCGAAGVVGPGREVEDGPAAVVWAAELPGAEIETFEVRGEPGADPELMEGLPEPGAPADAVIVLADPRRFPTDGLVRRLGEEQPGTPVLGGLASAALDSAGCLIRDGEGTDAGAVGCALRGVDVTPCVSQGASPVGPEIAITEAEGNTIHELAFKPALERVSEIVAGLGPDERRQAAAGMLVGIVIDENRPEHERGDFLVRPIVGADRESGAIVVGEGVRVGQTLRLHVRDGASADADLRDALGLQSDALGEAGAAGALMFTCNGRGRRMFDLPDHDADAFEDALAAPVGGFFCAGEIGPVGGRNFLHGFTATMAIFAAG